MNEWPDCFWKLGALLMHQQCWHFGRDILSPHGNLLVAAGFDRTPPPDSEKGNSRYLRQCVGEPSLCLWAFGSMVFLPGDGGIFIGRYSLVPRWVGDPQAALASWNASRFATLEPVVTRRRIRAARRLMRFAFLAFASYEEEVIDRYGLDYRRTILRGWSHPAILPARLPEEWRRLSWHIPEPPLQWTREGTLGEPVAAQLLS
ncbi:MAG: hypothetical protein FJW38_25535 [Acidobacteria bacterium]|nr:hypothetical protein [Acidobacteriota bacterium]